MIICFNVNKRFLHGTTSIIIVIYFRKVLLLSKIIHLRLETKEIVKDVYYLDTRISIPVNVQ